MEKNSDTKREKWCGDKNSAGRIDSWFFYFEHDAISFWLWRKVSMWGDNDSKYNAN